MSSAEAPCLNCRDKHKKCDKRKPICNRCETKGLECIPIQPKIVFRKGSKANLDSCFAQDQTWVASKPRNWTALENSPPTFSAAQPLGTNNHAVEEEEEEEAVASAGTYDDRSNLDGFSSVKCPASRGHITSIRPDASIENDGIRPKRQRLGNPQNYSLDPNSSGPPETSGIQARLFSTTGDRGSDYGSAQNDSTPSSLIEYDQAQCYYSAGEKQPASSIFSNLQESCLFRYFIEELSSLFDHCDERKHFKLVVPRRARNCPTLRNAIFAVSSRHLSRLPQYITPRGILYHGQLLTDLNKSTAVEYMLECIPGLLRFPEIEDPVDQENIMAATVILRQYEEMEEEMEEEMQEENTENNELSSRSHERVNFLTITQSIIDSMVITYPIDQSLAAAAYWIAIRQEVYYALTRQRAPSIQFCPKDWNDSSVANTLIMFAGEVSQWCWGERSPEEWKRLRLRQQQLMRDWMHELEPILVQKPDKSKGEVFPTVWYSFDAQVTAIQHFELARMILIAENPHLENAGGAARRKAETVVRSIVLNICGIALSHERIRPALVNAVIAITLCGDFFVEQDERDALLGIIDRAKNMHIWPMRKPAQALQARWEMIDSVEI